MVGKFILLSVLIFFVMIARPATEWERSKDVSLIMEPRPGVIHEPYQKIIKERAEATGCPARHYCKRTLPEILPEVSPC
jgi:hypothetical protein